ncbi:TonB family protein [Neisseria leonii]|uniref:Protein TonB n=1 Tax=Neisseria leonii TaxID=2995413 RepID=A0A9X4E3L2_9NEIS|nr:energy transducer TonB [Neisseria sp. 51.81]MDD9328084.1 TonB family protein [Neisseria sp. 51.81]
MKNEPMLTPQTLAVVLLMHALLFAWSWQSRPPRLSESGDIQFVDLAAFGIPEGGSAAPPLPEPAPPKPAPEPEPKREQPKPEPKREKPPVKAVVTDSPKADMRREEAKPKPEPRPEPKPRPEPQAKPETKPAEATPRGEAVHRAAGSSGNGETAAVGSSKSRGTPEGGGSGSGAGSSAGNPIKATGSIPRPAYPALSLENGEEGTVMLKVLVAPGGRVERVSVAKSSGFARLDRAAANSAKNGRFNASAWMEFSVPVAFRIE